ncbi:MAG: transcription/translation regulatory transformer protein RfaH [Pseudomonas sp.]|uniref:transcription/translation regulatory transformer protein RfaH n=1 Tax=Pseudomonas abieticivorans TaxID=2931382 RepID=UPI0020C07000|nr:transcription/translation regulatory transformer protein RfaH [Pseudomonas sp. PIA16]MDE1166974.1 transcription/translation regulatory transformer protein RfaH [Pseudomonas sp.]
MSHFTDTANWYLIQTKPRQEARAEEHLLRQQFQCYRPLKSQPAELPKNRRGVEEELFPGYLFIRLAISDSWYPIRSTRGVARIVSFGAQPCPVQDALILQIRQRLAVSPAPQPFAQGETVLVRTGSSDIQAIFLSDDGEERAVILLNLLQREQRVSLPKSSLSHLAVQAC